MMLEPGTIIANRYEIHEKIGAGGMANVYRAKDKKLDRDVTFKVMREELASDETFKERFVKEARAAASLINPNIVNVYDVGQEGDINYLIMEYVDGVTLKDLINKRAPFDDDEVLGVAIQIAQGLEHAHRNNIIHRDIKPQNILVTHSGVVKVTDFGIARAATSSTTMVNSNAMGSVHYFSPEQARGGYVDNKSDIYALGIVMYEMATGSLPFDGDTAVSVAIKHISEVLPDITKINPRASKSLINIINNATQKQSANRYQTIADMSNDLKRALTKAKDDVIARTNSLEKSDTIMFSEMDMLQINKEVTENINFYDDEPSEDYEDDYDEEDDNTSVSGVRVAHNKKIERRVEIAAVVTSLVIIILLTSLFIFFQKRSNRIEPLELPEFVGMSSDEIERYAEELGIIIDIKEVYNDDVPENTAFSADIPEKVYPGDTISVSVSLGPQLYKVPTVVNKDITVAYELFSDTKFLEPSTIYVFDENMPIDVVVKQEPAGGTMAKPGTKIVLYPSKGQEIKTVMVPKAVEEREGVAIEKLQNAGLTVGQIVREYHETVPEGIVISQSIPEGKNVSRNSVVVITVSKGIPVPSESPAPQETSEPVAKKFIVSPPLPPDRQAVNLKIIQISESGTTTFFDRTVNIEFFPREFEVKGEGVVEYHVYFVDEDGNETLQEIKQVDFSEGASE